MIEGMKQQMEEAHGQQNEGVGRGVESFWRMALIVKEATENGATDHEIMIRMAEEARVFLAHHQASCEWMQVREWADLALLREQVGKTYGEV